MEYSVCGSPECTQWGSHTESEAATTHFSHGNIQGCEGRGVGVVHYARLRGKVCKGRMGCMGLWVMRDKTPICKQWWARMKAGGL